MMSTTTGRSSRAEKGSAHIREAIEQNPLQTIYYLDLWLSHEESLGKVVMSERQWLKDQTKSKLSTAWLTLGQLEKIYGDVKVAQGIGKNKPPEHIRPHPTCPEVEEATPYLSTLHDHKIRQVEKGTEKGVSFTAEVDASDKDVIKACTDKFAQDTALDNPAAKGLPVADEERQAQIKPTRNKTDK